MAKKKNDSMKKKVTASINKGMAPIEFSLNSIKNIFKKAKKAAPLVYEQVEELIKHNLVDIEDRSRIHKKEDLLALGDKITSSLIGRIPNVDERELRKIVRDKTSQSFIDMVAKGLSLGYRERSYTILPKRKKFNKVLIANRGEIALRIIRACREIGITTVQVYSEPDKDSLAVKYADESYLLGDEKSYLNIDKIIRAAKKMGADAIHPGYGFLAENAGFAKLCEKNKIKFIGPSSKVIGLLGDKVMAKKTTIKAKVPVIEGTETPLKNPKHALQTAEKIGFPVIIKAAAGGGGKGMRIVKSAGDIEKAYSSAEAEAEMAFKDKTLYMEKYIEDPRHIEFQILADQYGHVIHLGERDCSIQRKHQKLVEEAPSPALDEKSRRKMGEAAVRIAKLSKYEGAGTVEFLLDKDNNFYFIEMNTRIQVEHGVTEMITGVDLVKEQIKIASKAKMALEQDDITIDGWAVECRINAENPLEDFVPSTGMVLNYLPPGGPGIRVNSICHSGYRVLPHYDSLISLLICHGKTRKEALSRMHRALHEYVIDGVSTTIPFHLAVLHNKKFKQGTFTTSFIEQENILQCVKDFCWTKEEMSEEQKVLVVSTAASKYLDKKKSSNMPSSWSSAGRQELMEQFER